jgi:hypothetical protein
MVDPTFPGHALDEAGRSRHRARRVMLEPEGEGEEEQHLGVGRAGDLQEQGRIGVPI